MLCRAERPYHEHVHNGKIRWVVKVRADSQAYSKVGGGGGGGWTQNPLTTFYVIDPIVVSSQNTNSSEYFSRLIYNFIPILSAVFHAQQINDVKFTYNAKRWVKLG